MDAGLSAHHSSPSPEPNARVERPGVTFISPQELTPDYASARHYLAALTSIDMDLNQHRQQVVLTNDVDAAARLVTNYILGVKPLLPPDDSLLAGLMSAFSLSNDELFSGPDPRRSAPRVFKEVVRFELGDPDFSAVLSEVASGRAPSQFHRPREFDYLMDRSWSDLFVDFFEARANQTLFVGTLRPPADPVAAAKWLGDFAYQHYLLQHQEGDYSDVLYRVPQIIWIAPFGLTQPLAPFSALCAAKTPLFTVPYHEWLYCADDLIQEPDPCIHGLERDVEFAIYTNRLHLYSDLTTISIRLKRIQSEGGKSDEYMQSHFSLTSAEWQFLKHENLDFDFIARNPESCWFPARCRGMVLERLQGREPSCEGAKT